ncbi:hypothetical protein [Pontibacter chitinilyticus]|uniref:hypothetical protein n=1 Tax=Pontibacter chitinilyticus TaxID=2674989 RepID=UPI003219594C
MLHYIFNVNKPAVLFLAFAGFGLMQTRAAAQVASFSSIALHLSNRAAAVAVCQEQQLLAVQTNTKAALNLVPVTNSLPGSTAPVPVLCPTTGSKAMTEELQAWVITTATASKKGRHSR